MGSSYFNILIGLGITIMLMSFLPVYTKKLKISYVLPILVLGILLYLFDIPLKWTVPFENFKIGKLFTEIIVIISLMVAGLKIGTTYSLDTWKIPLKLVFITMPLSIVVVFLICYYLLQLPSAESLLIASVLAPTDPVLASGLQLEKYDNKGRDKGLRFALTGEAAINDGMAFPFVYIAILWSQSSGFFDLDFQDIVIHYFMYKIFVGLLIGLSIGLLLSYILAKHTTQNQLKITNSFLALALTLLSYGIAETANTYGFLSVFATGVGLQYFNRERKEQEKSYLLSYIEKTEELLALLWALFFGGAIASGLLDSWTLEIIIFALVFVLFIRPITGVLAFIGKTKTRKNWAIAFFGIKGIGSLFYLFFALYKGDFSNPEILITITCLVVLFSILIHGVFSRRVINYFNQS